MAFTLRPPTDDDWASIAELAEQAMPNGGAGAWFAERKGFDERRHKRYPHILLEDHNLIGYAAVESSMEWGRYRIVMAVVPFLLEIAGDLLFARLETDLRDVGANIAWARERADNTDMIEFLQRRGLMVADRVRDADGIEAVVLSKRLSSLIPE